MPAARQTILEEERERVGVDEMRRMLTRAMKFGHPMRCAYIPFRLRNLMTDSLSGSTSGMISNNSYQWHWTENKSSTIVGLKACTST